MTEKMKGVIVSKVCGPWEIVDNIEKPTPGPHQILVKSLVTGINPVEGMMQGSGIMITAWPIVLGCDASGTVVEIGEGVTKFKKGDGAFGCTRLGVVGHSTFQEYFLMDEERAFKRPANITVEQAATIGVGALTACLGAVIGTHIELAPKKVDENSKWVVILGAAGSVGQFSIQIAKLCGYKVLASCSPSNDSVVKSFGADATFNYKIPFEDQIKEIGNLTGGKFSRVFDASAMATETGMTALATYTDPDEKHKYFATTNDWIPIEPKEGIEIDTVELGEIGREGSAHIEKTNREIASFIPTLEQLLGSGALKPMEYEFIEGVNFEPVLKGLELLSSRKSDGKKVVVRIAKE